MFPTPNPRNGPILSPVHQVTIIQRTAIRFIGVMVTRLPPKEKIVGSSPIWNGKFLILVVILRTNRPFFIFLS